MESFLIEGRDITNTCRFCHRDAQTESCNMYPIFSDKNLLKLIADVLHFKITDVLGFPKFVCSECVANLKIFSNLQATVRRNEEIFRNTYEKKKSDAVVALQTFSKNIRIECKKDLKEEAKLVAKEKSKCRKKFKHIKHK